MQCLLIFAPSGCSRPYKSVLVEAAIAMVDFVLNESLNIQCSTVQGRAGQYVSSVGNAGYFSYIICFGYPEGAYQALGGLSFLWCVQCVVNDESIFPHLGATEDATCCRRAHLLYVPQHVLLENIQ